MNFGRAFKEALRRRQLHTNKKENVLLIVGETGVRKTAVLSLLDSFLNGRVYSNYQIAHDVTNEAGGSQSGGQTNEAQVYVYEFRSLNGFAVRMLDIPRLTDICGMSCDEEQKASITKAIQDAVPVINGVLIAAYGTNTRLSVSMDYALTTLSSMFPHSIKDNIDVLFNMISNPLSFNFEMDSLPECLRDVETFIIAELLPMKTGKGKKKRLRGLADLG